MTMLISVFILILLMLSVLIPLSATGSLDGDNKFNPLKVTIYTGSDFKDLSAFNLAFFLRLFLKRVRNRKSLLHIQY